MRPSPHIQAAGAFLLLAMAAAPASSQQARGELGARSKASIGISVSVMPRFQLSSAQLAPGVTSNAPALRYSIVHEPVETPAKANAPGAITGGYSLLLVVPD